MRKALSLFMALLLMTGFVAGLQRTAAAQGSTASGTSIIDSSGNEVATVTVDSILDPFDAYASGYEPNRGFRYVLLTVTVTSVSDSPFYVQPYGFTIVDGEGFIASRAYVSYEPGVAEPELPDQEIEAGESVTGTVAFELLAAAEISAITYAPNYDRNYILASNSSAGASGGPTSILGEDGGELGTLTIGEISDPLEDADPNYAAPRGYHYIGVEVTIENTSSRPLSVDPSRLRIHDTDGFVNSYYGVYRDTEATDALPNLEYSDLAPGDSITGLVNFSVFNDSAPAFLVWTDGYTQFQIVMTFDDAPSIPSIDEIPVTAAGSVSTPVATAAADLSPECQELADWADDLSVAIEALNSGAVTIGSLEDLEELSVDEINEQVDLLNDFLDNVDEIDTPAAAEEALDGLVDFIELQVDGFEAVADAKDAGEDLEPIFEEFNTQVDASAEIYLAAFEELEELCPTIG